MRRAVPVRLVSACFFAAALALACDESTEPLPPGDFDATFAFSPDSNISGEAIFVGGSESGVTVNMTSEDGLVIRVSRGAFGNVGPYPVGNALGRFTGFVRLPVNGEIVEYTLIDGLITVHSVSSRSLTADLQATAENTTEGLPRTTFTFTATISANCQGVCLF